MNPRSLVKLTPEDQLTVQRWTRRLGAVYGAVLVMLVLIIAAAPRQKPEIASSRSAPDSTAAAMVDSRSTP